MEDQYSAKLTKEKANELRKLSEQGWMVKQLMQRYSIGSNAVRKVLDGRTWRTDEYIRSQSSFSSLA